MTEDQSRNRDEESGGEQCPVPLAHERLEEAHWQLHQMMDHYHHPAQFRFSCNAFLHSLKSVLDMLRIDLERKGQNDWRRQRLDALKADPVFRAFSEGRDMVVHRGSLVNSSRVDLGLIKYDKVKFAIQQDLRSDQPSHDLLAHLVEKNAETEHGLFVPPDHPFLGEQLGVRRVYFEPSLSKDQDVVTASNAAWLKVREAVEDAHKLFKMTFASDDHSGASGHDLKRVWLYLETDADPDLLSLWKWD
ncbi:hypothetical protein ACFVWT_11140 [Arthrobacter sp. NPDC058288]|uniref:hypothetical protein n=1 Tax=Arthrobacter sp. NPDC058288 TaxID=3346424 RepID=UPI0036E471C2